MTAESREELLSAYLDNELTADQRAQVEAWLAESADYRQLFEELRAVRHDLESLPRHKLEVDLGPAVLRRTERSVLTGPRPSVAGEIMPRSGIREWWSRAGSRRMFLWPAVAVAAALVVALFDVGSEREAREVAKGPLAEPQNEKLAQSDRAIPAEKFRRGGAAIRRVDTYGTSEGAQPALVDDRKEGAPTALGLQVEPQAGEAKLAKEPVRDEVMQRSAVAADALPADGASARGAPAAPVPAAAEAPAPVLANSVANLKLETDVQRVLANTEQLKFLQCDVSPAFVADKQMEKTLVTNGVAVEGYAAPQQQAKDQSRVSSRQEKPDELRYTIEASPAQLGQIVVELEKEQSRQRVSNLRFALEEAPAGNKVAAGRQSAAQRYNIQKQSQQGVTIYLRKMDGAKPAEPANPPQKVKS
jgi:hypothetical protein